MFSLFVPFYKEEKKERLEEYLFCISKNLKNPLIENIFLLFEYISDTEKGLQEWMPDILKSEKIKIKFCRRKRPRHTSYLDFIKYANEVLEKGKKFIVANMDVFFDDTLNQVVDFDLSKTTFALTRYNFDKYNGVLDREWKRETYSQDSWFFQTPMSENSRFNLNLGWIGCDNRIAYELDRAGYDVLNISESIKTWHVHADTVQKELYQNDNSYKFDGKPYKFLPFYSLKQVQSPSFQYIRMHAEDRKVLEWQIGVYKRKIDDESFVYMDDKTEEVFKNTPNAADDNGLMSRIKKLFV